VTFGGLTGADVKLNVQSLYSKQIKLIGCNGGTRKEMTEVIYILVLIAAMAYFQYQQIINVDWVGAVI